MAPSKFSLSPSERDRARFASKFQFNSDTGCWDWIGATDPGGYGHFLYAGVIGYAHRISYLWHKGYIQEGTEIDHVCRNRGCVNPEHLEAVSHRENVLRSPIHRGVVQRARTHCKNGHEFTAANTYADKKGGRVCRECGRIRGRAQYRLAKEIS